MIQFIFSAYRPLKLATATLPLTDLASDPNSTATTSAATWLPMTVTDTTGADASDVVRLEEKDEKVDLISGQRLKSYSSASLQVRAYMTTSQTPPYTTTDEKAISSSLYSSHAYVLPLCMLFSPLPRTNKHLISDEVPLINSLNYKDVLAQCYDWTWSLGEEGLDPLIDSPASLSTRSDSDARQPSTDKVHISVTPTSTILPDEKLPDLVSDNSLLSVPRVDCFYPITWLETHIESIEAFILYISKALIEADTFVYSTSTPVADMSIYDALVSQLGHNSENDNVVSTVGRTFFRGSRMKKDLFAQALAKNLHIQCMLVRPHSDLNRVTVYDSTTCGCMSPHAMTPPQLIAIKPSLHLPSTTPTGPTTTPTPHSSTAPHGLLLLEDRLQSSLNHLDSLKQHYTTLIDHKRELVPDTRSLEYNIHHDIIHNALTYETNRLQISQRKVFPTAQVLSIALNAVLVKLSLVVEGHISHDVANTWLTHGILLTFECLLSVIGGERVMIEDSAAVIHALKHYKIRILPSSNLTSHATISTNRADDEDKECSTVSHQLSKDGREMLKNLKLNPDKRHRMIQGMLYTYTSIPYTFSYITAC